MLVHIFAWLILKSSKNGFLELWYILIYDEEKVSGIIRNIIARAVSKSMAQPQLTEAKVHNAHSNNK